MESSITGKWIGFYIQFSGTERAHAYSRQDFEMDVIETQDGFAGVCYDIEIIPGKREQASVSGFVDGEVISFRKQYENCILFDPDLGETWIEEGMTPGEVYYNGRYDASRDVYVGTWEQHFADGSGEPGVSDIDSGYWEMKKTLVRVMG